MGWTSRERSREGSGVKKAWLFNNWEEGSAIVVSAETRGRAFDYGANHLNMSFGEAIDGRCRVKRFPALDDKPITDWSGLMAGAYSYIYCVECGCNVYSNGNGGAYAFGDDGNETIAIERNGRAYCSAQCLGALTPGMEAA